ncbi:MAG: Bug family tripartite tricarboxylate transporter substrate binding protein [Hydrogenophaga sp.]|uniref:Bug family tripartite tricarboxylate transporter substrate binding protein n=2 Tax=Pseudomonadota TaxID=1224 RepID=UPI0036D27C27
MKTTTSWMGLGRLAVGALALACAAPAWAQPEAAYPTKPVRLIVPLGAGGAPDVVTRLLSQILTEKNGPSFVVENRPGANTIIGTDTCAKAPPDGSTLCVVSGSSLSINPHLYRKLPYDAAKDFEAVTPLVVPDMVFLVSPSVPVNSMKELIAHAQKHPGKLAYGSFGNGSDTHLTMEWLKRATKTDLLHVPFNGFGPMMQAFLTGDIQVLYVSVGNPGIVAQAKAGKMRALAVLAPTRSAQLPEVPTLTEAGVGDPGTFTWFGLMAPAGTPRGIVNKLNAQITAAMQTPAMREQNQTMAMRTRAQTPEEFAAFLKKDREVWGELVRQTGIQLD